MKLERRIFRNWGIALGIGALAAVALGTHIVYRRGLDMHGTHLLMQLHLIGQPVSKATTDAALERIPQSTAAFDSAPSAFPIEYVLVHRVDSQTLLLDRIWGRNRVAGPVRLAPGNRAPAPLLRALAGTSGFMTARDFRGEAVLAAYRPLPVAGWGLVAKMRLADVRRPYWIGGTLVGAVTLLLLYSALALLARLIRPLYAQLRDSEARYRSIIQSMDESVIVIDERGIIQSANPASENLFGYRERELVGRNVKLLMPDQYADRHDGYLQRYVATGEKHIIGVGREVHGLRRDGSEFPLQLFVGEMTLDGARYFIGIMHDISIRKQAEAEIIEARARAEQAAASKAQFLANMSHEIRTPMNGVLGTLELLSQGRLEAEERSYVAMAQSSAASLLTLIDDILNLSKIEAGRTELDLIATDLHAVVEDSASIAAGLALEKSLRLNCYIAPDVPAQVVADPARLRQVLMNLLGNAVKFTERGEVDLVAEVCGRDGDRVRLRFSVRDTGIGIAPHRLDTLFEPFTQADSSITRRYGGTGLGLTITRELVQLMGGRIDVDSEPGKGSTFHVTIPFAVVEPSTPAGRPGANTDLRVLVVDDNGTSRENLAHYLADAGIVSVDTASSADAALDLLRGAAEHGRQHQLVLLKHPLPGSERLGAAVVGDERFSSSRLVTLLPANEPAHKIQLSGCDSFLVRPVRRAKLARVLEGLCGAPGDMSAQELPGTDTDRDAGADGTRILLAEDTLINQRVCQEMLQRFGVSALVAEDGSQAVDRVRQEHFDLVLMDCQMPVMDGYEATRRIRRWERESGATRTVIVAITAHAMEGDRESCLAAGMDDYLPKPFRMKSLKELLLRWLPEAVTVPDELR